MSRLLKVNETAIMNSGLRFVHEKGIRAGGSKARAVIDIIKGCSTVLEVKEMFALLVEDQKSRQPQRPFHTSESFMYWLLHFVRQGNLELMPESPNSYIAEISRSEAKPSTKIIEAGVVLTRFVDQIPFEPSPVVAKPKKTSQDPDIVHKASTYRIRVNALNLSIERGKKDVENLEELIRNQQKELDAVQKVLEAYDSLLTALEEVKNPIVGK